jgi:YfiH family protein
MELITAKNGVKYIKSSCLLSPHGFSTRVGGVSTAPHTQSLNLAFGRGDNRETVFENLKLFAQALDILPENIVSVPQIHSNKIMNLKKSDCGLGYYKNSTVSLDGYVTVEKGVAPGVKTADCVPILFEVRKNGVVCAVGAAHAGWRGTAHNIAGEAARELCKISGCNLDEIFVAIGPCIDQCCFETDKNVKNEFSRLQGEEIANSYISYNEGKNKYYPNLKGINKRLLENIGIPEGNIDVSTLCTYCHPELFYSHRLTKGIRGTMLSLISI